MGDAKMFGPFAGKTAASPGSAWVRVGSRGFAWVRIDGVGCGWCACLGGPFSAGKLLISRVLAAAEGGCVASHPSPS
jgi:hypothetical protein